MSVTRIREGKRLNKESLEILWVRSDPTNITRIEDVKFIR